MYEGSVGQLVIYPASRDKTVYVGTVLSNYVWDRASRFPHKRCVEWKYMIPKSEFSSAARYELGAARTFFEFRRNAKEMLAIILDKSVARFRTAVKAE